MRWEVASFINTKRLRRSQRPIELTDVNKREIHMKLKFNINVFLVFIICCNGVAWASSISSIPIAVTNNYVFGGDVEKTTIQGYSGSICSGSALTGTNWERGSQFAPSKFIAHGTNTYHLGIGPGNNPIVTPISTIACPSTLNVGSIRVDALELSVGPCHVSDCMVVTCSGVSSISTITPNQFSITCSS